MWGNPVTLQLVQNGKVLHARLAELILLQLGARTLPEWLLPASPSPHCQLARKTLSLGSSDPSRHEHPDSDELEGWFEVERKFKLL